MDTNGLPTCDKNRTFEVEIHLLQDRAKKMKSDYKREHFGLQFPSQSLIRLGRLDKDGYARRATCKGYSLTPKFVPVS